MENQKRLVDVSRTIETGMPMMPGLPTPVVSDYLSRTASRSRYEQGTAFHLGKIDLMANTGTYIDVPFHRFEAGRDLEDVPLDALGDLPGLTVPVLAAHGRALTPTMFAQLDLAGKAVLLRTGWDRFWGSEDYFTGYPYVTASAASFLRDAGIALLGTDTPNVDDIADGGRPVHTILLSAGIPIVENLCKLDQLPIHDYNFFAVPVKINGLGSFPIRAFAMV